MEKIPDPHAYFRNIERLHQQLGRARGQGAAFVFSRVVAGQNQHRNLVFALSIRPQRFQNLKSIDIGHRQVEEDQVWFKTFDHLEGTGRIVDAAELIVADAMKKIRHQTGAVDVVIHHQDARFFQSRFIHRENLLSASWFRPRWFLARGGPLRQGEESVPPVSPGISFRNFPEEPFPLPRD